ncbi:SCO1860 family LAETG-anchored protein [Streptomyces sp. SL13]|uniref:SCO1860 family LAETG-anchored protein n=1 Tax=Streptantibioticus silvisoli TaxID=2705255 RepID=A0AA90HAW1_9ACTN|nr:SCO1860 family LAETG-anchored protein [Streptantibioticus silvisoli]MDI5973202.1 SCO1860 family LAETG-anchored protein [Streptantibioticus silvisoli]
MHRPVLSKPARRSAAVAAAAALAAVALAPAPNALAATAGPGATHPGTAGAAVLRAGLDVTLLRRTVGVPLDVTLDDVHAPGDARGTALSARLDGIDGGHPFGVLRADVATARATADGRRAQGYADLVDARVTLPGLPGPLLTVRTATSRATCDAGRRPTATSEVLGTVGVLGRPVTLTAGGTDVRVPGAGEVRLTLSRTAATSTTAAATALHLTVAVDPLGLGVATVKGDISLAAASCTTPGGHSGGSSGGFGSGGTGSGGSGGGGGADGGSGGGGSGSGGASGGPGASGGGGSSGAGASGGDGTSGAGASGGSGRTGAASGAGSAGSSGSSVRPVSVTTTGRDLAETGAGPATPLLVAGAVVLLIAGGTVLLVARRRRAGPRD